MYVSQFSRRLKKVTTNTTSYIPIHTHTTQLFCSSVLTAACLPAWSVSQSVAPSHRKNRVCQCLCSMMTHTTLSILHTHINTNSRNLVVHQGQGLLPLQNLSSWLARRRLHGVLTIKKHTQSKIPCCTYKQVCRYVKDHHVQDNNVVSTQLCSNSMPFKFFIASSFWYLTL